MSYQRADAQAWIASIKAKTVNLGGRIDAFIKIKKHLGAVMHECNKQLMGLKKWYLKNGAVKVDGHWASPEYKKVRDEQDRKESWLIVSRLLTIIDRSKIDDVLNEEQAMRVRVMIEKQNKREKYE